MKLFKPNNNFKVVGFDFFGEKKKKLSLNINKIKKFKHGTILVQSAKKK